MKIRLYDTAHHATKVLEFDCLELKISHGEAVAILSDDQIAKLRADCPKRQGGVREIGV